MKCLILILILIFSSFGFVDAQSFDSDWALLSKEKKSENTSKTKISLNPLKIPYRFSKTFYHKAISEQLAANCAFELTCSRFSKAMVNKFGFVKGYFLTFDRLGRCNAISPLETYPIRLNAQRKIMETPSDFHFH